MPFNTIEAYRGVCNLFGPWAFYGIAGQIVAILATDRLGKAEPYLGNAVFWTMFCIIGQPMAVSEVYMVYCICACLCAVLIRVHVLISSPHFPPLPKQK